jgi:2-polyprenyl-3-methyl-5-hydroxy-6-metoxy-1,4-benzoquinol methylase
MNLLSLYHNVDYENRKHILDLIEVDAKARIIDLGCADGKFAKKLAEKAGTRDIFGADFLEESCLKAKASGIKVHCADLNEQLPFENESFDVVHANQVLEHLPGTDRFVTEVYRILRPGGYAIISTPNLASLHNIFSLVLGKQPFTAHVSNEVILGNSLDPKCGLLHASRGEVHLRIFTPEALKELFKYHGFTVEQMIGVGYYPFPGLLAAFLTKLDKNHSVYITIKVRK